MSSNPLRARSVGTVKRVRMRGGTPAFTTTRDSALRAQHESWSTFPWVEATGRFVFVEGIPTDGSMITAGPEAFGYELPTYTVSEVSVIFFFRRNRRWLLGAIERSGGIPAPGTPFHIPPPDGRGRCWTLADVERMIRFLAERRVLDFDQMMSSLQMVLWTLKGHRLHA